MKKFVCLCFGVMFAFSLHAQPRKYFCEIRGMNKSFSSGMIITFNFGDNPKYSIGKGTKDDKILVDDNGKELEFNNMVDAANYLTEKGWSFQQAYSSFYGGAAVYNWLFYKEAENKEEAGKGIMTKETYKQLKK